MGEQEVDNDNGLAARNAPRAEGKHWLLAGAVGAAPAL